jgi:hypothetical protein
MFFGVCLVDRGREKGSERVKENEVFVERVLLSFSCVGSESGVDFIYVFMGYGSEFETKSEAFDDEEEM